MDNRENIVIRDRRRNKRTSIPINYSIVSEDSFYKIVGETKNLSCVGANCKTNIPIAEMTKLRLTLALPSGDETFDGVVVRSEKQGDEYNIAIYFSEIDLGIQNKIDMFVKNQK